MKSSLTSFSRSIIILAAITLLIPKLVFNPFTTMQETVKRDF